MFGHETRGRRVAPTIDPYWRMTQVDGSFTAAIGTDMIEGDSRIEGDAICTSIPTRGRACRVVYRNPGGTFDQKNEYLLFRNRDRFRVLGHQVSSGLGPNLDVERFGPKVALGSRAVMSASGKPVGRPVSSIALGLTWQERAGYGGLERCPVSARPRRGRSWRNQARVMLASWDGRQALGADDVVRHRGIRERPPGSTAQGAGPREAPLQPRLRGAPQGGDATPQTSGIAAFAACSNTNPVAVTCRYRRPARRPFPSEMPVSDSRETQIPER